MAAIDDIVETMPSGSRVFHLVNRLLMKILLSVTIGNGTVSKIIRDKNAGYTINTIQINGDVNPGNSGGPILDQHGKVIGVAKQTIVGCSDCIGNSFNIVEIALGGSISCSTTIISNTSEGVTL